MSLESKYALISPDYHWKAVEKGLEMSLPTLARYQLVLKILDSKINGSKILDAGCGDGVLSWMLAIRGGEVYGVDVEKKALQVAKRKCKGLKARFYPASIYDLPFPSRYFDHIVCLDVIEHLHHPDKALKELKRVWNRSGMIIITTPIRWKEQFGIGFHVKEYSIEEFREIIRKHFPMERVYFIHFGPILVHKLTKLKIGRFRPLKVVMNAFYLLTRINPYLIPLPWKNISQAAIIRH